ncbi:DUF1697 domain-containing protein [Ferriphaselus sp. R-1]|uniref:DUF1697 domain-containing protein n=1 Tax=Ferriphaselus sp. R-1 TaxID=1485544 RepID=UPI0005557DC8|nr:DUF1697 domain-containing protein [Ferriphaselus sp. R-1]
MNTYLALFRGINVGGNHLLPMKELVVVLEGLGLQSVRTYIQSGNAVFHSTAAAPTQLAAQISAAIHASHGFDPQVFLLDADGLSAIIASNPFPEAEGNALHFNFCDELPPAPDLAGMERLKAADERYALKGKVLYLHAPQGIGRSKLTAKLERLLGVPITTRNWNTVRKLQEMVKN